MNAFGVWLQRELGRRDLSVRRFAQQVGTSHTTVNGWIRGDRDPERAHLLRVAAVLEVSPVMVGMIYLGAVPDGAEVRRFNRLPPEAQAEVVAAMQELIDLVYVETERTRESVAGWAERWAQGGGASGRSRSLSG